MRIIELATWEETVPPRMYGGVELVASHVTEGLVAAGHEVFLLAAGNSTTSATLIPLMEKTLREMYPTGKLSEKEIADYRTYWKFAKFGEILSIIDEIKPDIVHNHQAWRFTLFSKLVKYPILTTMHGPLSSIFERTTYVNFKDENYVSISNSQRRAMPELHWVRTIYNGIDTEMYPLGPGGNYFVFLGRTSPEKGLGEIVRAVAGTRHQLKIAAKVDAVDVEYFEAKVKPYIDGKQIQFLGEVGMEEKVELLQHAKGMLLWLNWEEPFGLAVIEAMACGVPVIVNRRGSMPELILDTETGYFVDSPEEMRARMDMVEKIPRLACRDHVLKLFSKERMVSEYEALMQEMAAQNR